MNKAVRIMCGLTVFYLANKKKTKKQKTTTTTTTKYTTNCIKYLMYGESVLPPQKQLIARPLCC